MLTRLVIGLVLRSWEPEPQHPAGVALIDLGLVLLGGPHPLHGADGIADKARSPLRIEGKIGPEEDALGAEEGQPALHRMVRTEEGSVTVEHPEVLDRSSLQASEGRRVVGIVAAAAE